MPTQSLHRAPQQELPQELERWVTALRDRDLNPQPAGRNDNGGPQFTALCPAHRDRSPSLSLGWNPTSSRVLATCHRGDTFEDVAKALGIKSAGSAARPVPIDYYDYEAEDGTLIAQVVRYEPKTFRQRVPPPGVNRPENEQHAAWNWSVKGVALPPYNLPSLAEALDSGDPVYIVEGEKDVQALWQGLSAIGTCNAGGAGKWTDAHSTYFEGAHSRVRIVADKDVPGYKHAVSVYESLLRVAGITAEIVLSQGDKDAADHVSDFGEDDWIPMSIEAARSAAMEPDLAAEDERAEDVAGRAENMRRNREARVLVDGESWRMPVERGSAADQLAEAPEEVAWQWEGLVQVGWNVLVHAPAKAGKTTLVLNFLRSITDGTPLFGRYAARPLPPGRRAAWWNAELSRSQAMQWVGDMGFEHPELLFPLHLRETSPRMPFEVPAVREWAVTWLRDNNVAVWVLDTTSAMFAGDENSNTEVGAWLTAIDEVKAAAGVETLILVHHTGHGSPDSDGPAHARGASRFAGWADLPLAYSGSGAETRWLTTPYGARDVEVNVGLDFTTATRTLTVRDGATSARAERAVRAARAAGEAVWRRPDDATPLTATDLQDLVVDAVGGKRQDHRASIRDAVAHDWVVETVGPRNSKLYSRGGVDPTHPRVVVNPGPDA